MSRRKRQLRNYLLDYRFQLKYTGMVVLVTVIVAAALAFVAYDYSRGQTESLALQIAMQPELNPEAADDLEAFARSEDQKVLLGILAGIAIMALALGATGIIVTHRVVGPAYRMRMLFDEVAQGHRQVRTRIRKGDELQELFEAFSSMLGTVRAQEEQIVEELSQALVQAQAAGASEASLEELRDVIQRMRDGLA